jgi:uncharacterized membrane protein YdjX (TVP38/TMEM64 family)
VSRRRLGLSLALAALVLVAFLGVRRALGLEFDPGSLQQVASEMGVWGPLVYVGIVAFRVPLGLPSQLLLVGGGLVFGTLTATLCGALGLTLSAVGLFLAARVTGRASIEARVPPRMRPVLELASTRLGAFFLALGTAYPFGPITMYHLLAGVTGMGLAVFVLAVGVGALGRAALFSFFGSRIVEGGLVGAAQAGAVLALAVALPLALPRTRRWIFDAFRATRGGSGEGAPR